MLFKRKKESAAILQQTERRLGDLKEQLKQQNEAQERYSAAFREEFQQGIEKLRKDISRQDMAIEDLLDAWEQSREDASEAAAIRKEAGRTEENLLQLIEAYQQAFESIQGYAESNDANLQSQLGLMEDKLQQYRGPCGIALIKGCGQPVNYAAQEIIEVKDTEDATLDGAVAQVYQSGYYYQGKVRKKAKVSVYRSK